MTEEPEPIWYVASPSYAMARGYAIIDHNRTGLGYGRPTGPRPWKFINGGDDLRGRRFNLSQYHEVTAPGHQFRQYVAEDLYWALLHATRQDTP